MFCKSLGQSWPTAQRASNTWYWGFVGWSLVLGGSIVNPDGKFSFKLYAHIYVQMCVYCRLFSFLVDCY